MELRIGYIIIQPIIALGLLHSQEVRESVDGSFSDLGNLGYWWSSTEYDYNLGWYRRLEAFDGNINRVNYNKALGSSVRCLKNQTFRTNEN